jgi:hypothetical protein
MKNLRATSAGFTIVEVIIAMGITMGLVASLTAMMTVMSKRKAQVENLSWADDLRFAVINASMNDKTFATYTMPSNYNMACVINKTDCAGQGGLIILYGTDGRPLPLLGNSNSALGITVRGQPCNTFGMTADCPFRYEVRWTPICPGGSGGCVAPQVQVNGTLLVNPLSQGNLPAMNLASMKVSVNRVETGAVNLNQVCGQLGGAVSGSQCILAIQGSQCGPGTYLRGYDGNGMPICANETTSFSCPPNGAIISINADGTVNCTSTCNGSAGQATPGGTLVFDR